MIWKESIFVYARWTAPFLGFRRFMTIDVFISSVRYCIIELRISQDTLVVGAGPTDR